MNNIITEIKKYYHKFKWLNYIYGDKNRPIIKNRVNVYYYKRAYGKDNVGDLLSLVVVDFLKKHYKLVDKPLKKTIRLFAIGSIIDLAKSDMTVWGSGLRNYKSKPPKVNFDIRAVRGPNTANKFIENNIDCPKIYGDPALLLPLIYQPKIASSKKKFVIIPHYSKEQLIPDIYKENLVTTLTSNWKAFIDDIVSADYVISGSLHGVIIAEAYGIPAVLLATSLDNDLFKYEDYYLGSGRDSFQLAESLEEAIKTPIYNQPIYDLESIQKNLIDSFPKDIY